MQRSRSMAPTHHAYNETESGSEFLITDRIFVTFKETVSDEQLDAFAGRYGLVKKAVYSDRDFLFQLTNHTGMNPVKLVVQLMEDEPLVEIAEHDLNQRMSTYQFSVPVDPEYSKQWHLHTDFNDLIIELISPDDTSVLLHNRRGGSADNIIKTYSMANTSNLQNLRGDSIAGDWRLHVSDHAGADQGKLNYWSLKLTPVA